jgi:hypothetical protein
VGGGKVVVELVEHHQITALLQATQGIQRGLDQEQIALAQHMPAETIAQGDAGALGGETHSIETLAKAQVPPVLNLGTGRGSSVKIPYELVERRPGDVP